MAISTSTRSPRGTKPVAQAFFAAADEIPEASRAAVIKAALSMIRDQLKADREKVAAAKAKAKGQDPAKKAAAKKAASRKKAAAKAPAKAKAKKAPAKRARKVAAPPMPEGQEADVATGEESED